MRLATLDIRELNDRPTAAYAQRIARMIKGAKCASGEVAINAIRREGTVGSELALGVENAMTQTQRSAPQWLK